MGESDQEIQAPGSAGKNQDDEMSTAARKPKPKPGLAIYRPGSGPLRRSNPVLDNSSDTSDKCLSSDKDTVKSCPTYAGEKARPPSKQRNRKPQQAFYVPKPLADRLNRKCQDSKGRSLSQADLNKTQYSDNRRSIRQGSEPRIIPSRHPLDRISSPYINDHRMRDSRSVEPDSLPSCKDSNVRENRPPANRGSSALESLSTTARHDEHNCPPTSTRAVDEWDGNTLTFVGRHQARGQVDPEPLRSTSDKVTSFGKSKETEGTQNQTSTSASEGVPLKDGNQRGGENVSQPSPSSGGTGVSRGRLQLAGLRVRTMRAMMLEASGNGGILVPGALKIVSQPESSPVASRETNTDECPVTTLHGKHQARAEVDPAPLRSTSDKVTSLGKSKETEGTQNQTSTSASEGVPLKDGNQRDGENVSQPSPSSGGTGVSRGRLQSAGLRVRTMGARILEVIGNGGILVPGALKTVSQPESSPVASRETNTDECPVMTLHDKHQARAEVDPEPLRSTSDIVTSLGKSKETEGTQNQTSTSASEGVPLKDGNQRDGENVSQPSPSSGGTGVSRGRLQLAGLRVRTMRAMMLEASGNGGILVPGALKIVSQPGSSPVASRETNTDECPVMTLHDRNSQQSPVFPVKTSTINQDSTASMPSFHKTADNDGDTNLLMPLDWSEEVEKAMPQSTDQEEKSSLSSEKVTSGSTSSRDGRRRRRRNRQGHESSKDGANVYRNSSNDRSSCSSLKFGQHCSSEENWDEPTVNYKPTDVSNLMQTSFQAKKLDSDCAERESSCLKKNDGRDNAGRSGIKSDERAKYSVSKNECYLQNNLANRARGNESRLHSRTENQDKFKCSTSKERYRASSGDRYRASSGDRYRTGGSTKFRAGSSDRFSQGGGNDGYHRANSKDKPGYLYNRDRFQRAGSRDRYSGYFLDKNRYARSDSVDRWCHDLFKPRSSETEKHTNDRCRSYSRERYNRSGSHERQLYDPRRDRFSRGMDSAGRYRPDSINTRSRRASNSETTSGVNTRSSVRSSSRERFKGTSRYLNTPSLDRSRSKQNTDRDYPEKNVEPVSKMEHAYERPTSVKSGRESSLEVPRREKIRDDHTDDDDDDDKNKGQRGSPATPSSCEEGNEGKSLSLSSSELTSRSGIIVLPAEVEERLNGTSREPHENLAKPISQEVLGHVAVHKHLYDPNNPNKPIPVVASGSRACRPESNQEVPPPYPGSDVHSTNYSMEMASCWNLRDDTIPCWLDADNPQSHAINAPRLIADTDSVVRELLWYINNGSLRSHWKHILALRVLLENLLSKFLKTDLKFCARENVEKYLWTVSTHKIIERLRELMSCEPYRKEEYKAKMLTLIESDTEHLEKLVRELEEVYHFKIESFLTPPVPSERREGNVGIALHSVQKIYLFLGDLARYKEEVNQSTNYGKCRQWYLKAHLIDPRNGLPYNQLAVIAVLARRKLDAVYYYMRSIMASNTVITAREKIVILFDEARRKYEMLERKRREENPPIDDLKEKESRMGLQREFWIHPQAGVPRLHITTSAVPDLLRDIYRQEDELRKLDSVELNKRFIISYINVQGKLYTKVGMDSFQEAAVYMLLEFRALIQHKPLPLNVLRFLQLLALNMFSLYTTKLRQAHDELYRSVFQENALIVALQMFNLILERCNSLLRDQLESGEQPRYLVPEDMVTLLPAIKVWCDWMLCHGKTWNPPPSCSDFKVGPPEDVWERFATFINLLEQLEIPEDLLKEIPVEGCDLVRLPEDSTLCYFKPLCGKTEDEPYYAKDDDMEVAYVALRIRKIVFFGSVFLCGIEPPVLKLHHSSHDASKYISVVQSCLRVSDLQSTSDIRLESFSEDEDEVEVNPEEAERRANIVREALKHEGGETLTLLRRREELERDLERHKIIVQEVLKNSQIYIEIEVKPRILIPDTNTFIDHLPFLRKILEISDGMEYFYTFGVPLVVFRELEGLSLGGRFCSFVKPDKLEHMEIVAEAAKDALLFLRSKHPRVRCFTTRGTMIPISSCVMNEDIDEFTCNDDRILATAVSLIASADEDVDEGGSEESPHPRRVLREVVLLTEDRCLRMKAMTKLVPTRDIPDFVKWAGLS